MTAITDIQSLNMRNERDWQLLCGEFNNCKRKLQTKKDALIILAKELDNVKQERDAYKLMAEQLRDKSNAQRKKFEEKERALGLSLCDSDHLYERRSQSLAQVLCESREQNRKAEAEIKQLKQSLLEAEGDVKLLRENIARQRVGDEGLGTRHFPAYERSELVKQLEATKDQLEALERDMVAKIDQEQELVTERDHYREKSERINQELNYVLGGDERRIVDVDALIMENKYVKERLKQCQEEKNLANTTVAKYKAALERKRGRTTLRLGAASSGGIVISQKQVEQLLAEGKATGLPATASSVADLQSLAAALLETIHDKNMALNHQRNTNKILGLRVAELEKKLKTLEISGLWNLPPGRSAAIVAKDEENMRAGLITLTPSTAPKENGDHDSKTTIVSSTTKENTVESRSAPQSARSTPVHQIRQGSPQLYSDTDSLISLDDFDLLASGDDNDSETSSINSINISRSLLAKSTTLDSYRRGAQVCDVLKTSILVKPSLPEGKASSNNNPELMAEDVNEYLQADEAKKTDEYHEHSVLLKSFTKSEADEAICEEDESMIKLEDIIDNITDKLTKQRLDEIQANDSPNASDPLLSRDVVSDRDEEDNH
ncbi:coiled-coil domain-containing protein 149-like [Anneissia japonica]|uniref:coiled-coil domain-containing protein 149-like n=1 Tax=Anneissia japonica TaxID=1529436 RepID=UPI0014259935|nr:coiled-coil domain-containing protein 149-like [Anneissia japonica]